MIQSRLTSHSGYKWRLDIFSLSPSVTCPQRLLFGPVVKYSQGRCCWTMALHSHFSILLAARSCWAHGWRGSPFDLCVYQGRAVVRLVITGSPSSSGSQPPFSSLVLPQPHLHSYKEAFEEMERTSPTSPPSSGGKNFTLSLPSLGPLWPV